MTREFFILALAFASLAAADGMKDPTRPPSTPTHEVRAAEPVPILTAVIGAGADRIAIINGQLIRRGGSVDGCVIEAVFDGGVTYRRAGVKHDLYLPRTASFKKPSSSAARLPTGAQ